MVAVEMVVLDVVVFVVSFCGIGYVVDVEVLVSL